MEAKREAEEKWKQNIQESNDKTLMPLTDSWYMGANIPGKKSEQLNYLGGLKNYERECREAIEFLDRHPPKRFAVTISSSVEKVKLL